MLLLEFTNVFNQPKELPPQHAHNHRMPLFPGCGPLKSERKAILIYRREIDSIGWDAWNKNCMAQVLVHIPLPSS